jgi:hypothetical protein
MRVPASPPRRQRIRSARVTIGWAIAASLLAGCARAQPHPTLKELRAVPGVTLTFPGALEYRRVATESAPGVDSGTPASIAVDACTSAAESELISWFDQHLKSAGWREDPATHSVDPGLFTRGYDWVKDGRRFDLMLETRRNADRVAAEADRAPGCPTPYRTLAQ